MLRRSTKSIVRGTLFRIAFRRKVKSPESEEAVSQNALICAARKKLLLWFGVPFLALVLIVGTVTAICLAHRGAQILPGENELSVPIDAESALLETIKAGDVVQLYTASGPIGSSRYLCVGKVHSDGIELLMTPEQLQDFLLARNQGAVSIIPVIRRDRAAATAALQLQRQWNHPDISLALSDSQLFLEPQSAAKLVYACKLEPQDAVMPDLQWLSSDPETVSVDDTGTISALKPGNAMVTLSGGGVSAQCRVSVILCAEALQFDAEAYNLVPGGEAVLSPRFTPEHATEPLSWESSDEAVATVSSDGIVTAVSGGDAVITVRGKYAQARCTVRVAIPVTGIVLNRSDLQLTVGQAGALVAAVVPEEATNKAVVWTSSDETVVTVGADGNVTAVASGTATVTASCGGVSAVCTVTVDP